MFHSNEDQQLLKHLKSGSMDSFNQFYEKFAPLIFRIAMGMVKDKQEAEDICHDIFIEIFNMPNRYNPDRGSMEAWLAVKTRSRCLDHLRRKQRLIVDDQVENKQLTSFSDFDPTGEQVVSKAEQETVRQALAKIPEPQRQALYASYFDYQTHKELALQMKRPLGTVKSLIRYGLNNIRKQLHHLGWSESSGGVHKK